MTTNTTSTKSTTSTKIDRNALKDALRGVAAAMGLRVGNKLTAEERMARAEAKAAKRASKIAARVAPVIEQVKTGKHLNSKTGKLRALTAARRIDLAFTLAKCGVEIPKEFFLAYPNLDKAADALVAAGAARKIDEARVRNAFGLPGGAKVQIAPASGGAIVTPIKEGKGKARKSA